MKTAWVLSGEGARGSVQAGIMVSLVEKFGYAMPETIYGCSSGAINAVAWAYARNNEEFLSLWRNTKSVFTWFDFNWLFPFTSTGLLRPSKLKTKIDAMRCRQPRCKFSISRVKVKTAAQEYIDYLDTQAVLDAVAIAGIVDVKDWFDGAARELAPLKKPIEDGYEKIVVILGRPLGFPAWEPTGLLGKPFLRQITYAYRSFDITLNEIVMRDINKCLDKNQKKGFKYIDIQVWAPPEVYLDALEYRKCADGVNFGYRNAKRMS